jgi:hypothetical protein
LPLRKARAVLKRGFQPRRTRRSGKQLLFRARWRLGLKNHLPGQMDMISHAADAEGLRARVSSDGGKIGVHSGADIDVQPWAERLWHVEAINEEGLLDESRLQRWLVCVRIPRDVASGL